MKRFDRPHSNSTDLVHSIRMAKKLAQIEAQIKKLQAAAEALKAKEVDGVVARIRTAIEHYGITADQLFERAKDVASKAATQTAGRRKSLAKGAKVAVKYRDGAENTWTGRGNKPRWLVARLAEGRKIEEFAV